eukprot:1325079-Amorphochlora_amoeboformis.AAC.1
MRITTPPFSRGRKSFSRPFMRCSVPRLPFFHAKLGARGFTILSSRNKVVSLEDAAAIVHNGDTVSCSGFVAQGAPEALLEALGKRFMATGEPKELTVFFGGGWDFVNS